MTAPLDPPVTTDQHYFALADLRVEQEIPYSDSQIEPNRDLAEQVLEHACGVAFIPRRRIETAAAAANGYLHLSMPLGREVEAVNDGSDWTPQEAAQLTIDNGYVIGASWLPGTRVTVTYTHGYDSPPLRVRRAAMIATRIWTAKGPVDDRATQVATDGATVNLATPGVLGSVTGIPEVDATISQHDWDAHVG